jgi:alkaline phosphatase D
MSDKKNLSRRQFLQQSAATFVLLSAKTVSAQAEPFVQFVWSGAVTSTLATVKAKLLKDSNTVRLLVSPNEDLSNPLYSDVSPARSDLNNRLVSVPMSGLTPDTPYYYAIEADDRVDMTRRGKFRTFPRSPASFSFAFGSCAETNSAHPIFETIRNLNPLFFLHTGDMHYRDISRNDPELFRQGYEAILASPTQSALYQDIPLVYMWDDHDFGPNDSDAFSPSREAARLSTPPPSAAGPEV